MTSVLVAAALVSYQARERQRAGIEAGLVNDALLIADLLSRSNVSGTR